MRKLSLMDLAFFIVESEDSPKHVANLMRCKKPANSAPDYAQKLIRELKSFDAVSEPFNLVINFFGFTGPQMAGPGRCSSPSFPPRLMMGWRGI